MAAYGWVLGAGGLLITDYWLVGWQFVELAGWGMVGGRL